MPKLSPIPDAPRLDQNAIRAFEQAIQCTIPDDYRQFLLQHNGGFPEPDIVSFQEWNRATFSDVYCFHALGDPRPWAGIERHRNLFEGRLPSTTIPIAHDSCGNLWLLDVGGGGGVYFFDHGSFDNFDETDLQNWPRVAESFQEFLDNLSVYDPSLEGDGVQSRYALVLHAQSGMAKQGTGFNKRAMPDGAWHVHPGGSGNFSMQFVMYAVHAGAPHTDGYSVMRAEAGEIPEGPTRLP